MKFAVRGAASDPPATVLRTTTTFAVLEGGSSLIGISCEAPEIMNAISVGKEKQIKGLNDAFD